MGPTLPWGRSAFFLGTGQPADWGRPGPRTDRAEEPHQLGRMVKWVGGGGAPGGPRFLDPCGITRDRPSVSCYVFLRGRSADRACGAPTGSVDGGGRFARRVGGWGGGGDVTPRIIRRGAAGGGRRQTVWSAEEIHQISPGRRRFLTDVTIAVLAWPVVSSVVVVFFCEMDAIFVDVLVMSC